MRFSLQSCNFSMEVRTWAIVLFNLELLAILGLSFEVESFVRDASLLQRLGLGR